MKGTVNPFEPWRPAADRIPPLLHVGRPWRPPPPPPVRAAVEEPRLVEPVKPSARNKPPEHPKRPQRQPGEPPSWRIVVAVVVYVGLVCLGLANMGLGEEAHVPRLWAVMLCVGLLGACAFLNRLQWYNPRLTASQKLFDARLTLAGMAVALALAGIALWFVPTTHGMNLWSAYQQVEELRALPAGDIVGYQRGAATRQTLVEDFPSFAADVSAAEQAWLRRTVDQAIENADRQLDKDPDAALTHLHQLSSELTEELKRYGSVRKELESARRRAVQACVKAVQKP